MQIAVSNCFGAAHLFLSAFFHFLQGAIHIFISGRFQTAIVQPIKPFIPDIEDKSKNSMRKILKRGNPGKSGLNRELMRQNGAPVAENRYE